MWDLSEKDRWCLYRRWVYDARERCYKNISDLQIRFDSRATILKEIKQEEDYEILRRADVIGMTTTGDIDKTEFTDFLFSSLIMSVNEFNYSGTLPCGYDCVRHVMLLTLKRAIPYL